MSKYIWTWLQVWLKFPKCLPISNPVKNTDPDGCEGKWLWQVSSLCTLAMTFSSSCSYIKGVTLRCVSHTSWWRCNCLSGQKSSCLSDCMRPKHTDVTRAFTDDSCCCLQSSACCSSYGHNLTAFKQHLLSSMLFQTYMFFSSTQKKKYSDQWMSRSESLH